MFDHCRQKLSHLPNIELRQESLLQTSLQDNSVDIVLVTQVLHHLDSDNKDASIYSPQFPHLEKAIREIKRVLVPGGRAIINMTAPQQYKGYWYFNHAMNQKVVERYYQINASLDFYKATFEKYGLGDYEQHKVVEPLIKKEYYFDLEKI